MKKFLLLFFATFLTGVCVVLADVENAVNLNITNKTTLSVPQSNVDMLKKANQRDKDYEYPDIDYFESDEDVFESKAGTAFSQFINDRAVNNKFTQYITDMQ